MLNYLIAAALIAGVVLVIRSDKTRDAEGEWRTGIEWGYLLLIMGIFGAMASWLNWGFTAILLIFTLVTGVIWVWQKSKKFTAEQKDPNCFRDYIASFFTIILAVFVLRTYIAEPFQIPSSSMRPGLEKGDFILVNKFAYGLRIPVLNTVAIPTGKIQRGDVVVFNYPLESNTNYIKRIVAVGGDTLEYKDKILSVNGKPSVDTRLGAYTYPDDRNSSMVREAERYLSEFMGKKFEVAKEKDAPSVDAPSWNHYQDLMTEMKYDSGLQENCQYAEDGSSFSCKIPEGKYFAMGDNRDASADSRYWGFVDDSKIVGKAFLVWLNFNNMSRIGHLID